jgi:transposase
MKENTSLPSDLNTCHEMINNLAEELSKSQFMIEKLQHQMSLLLKSRYGSRRDRIDPNQLKLFEIEDQETTPDNASEPEIIEEETHQRKKKKHKDHGRQILPSHLERKRIEHDITDEERNCGHCGAEKTRIGEEISERLEYEPASLYVIQDIRFKYACKDCEEEITTATLPFKPIDKGLAGPGLLAQIITSKYSDHLPLNRQENILHRNGVHVSRSTQCDWMRSCADLLGPLYQLMFSEVLRSKVIHTDDTPVSIQDKSLPKTRTGRFWVYIGDHDHPYSFFDFTPDRKRDGPANRLIDFEGYLQADAYSGYDHIYASKKVMEVACWAHARRKFVDAQSSDPKRSVAAVSWIKQLYGVEDKTKELSSEERCHMRQRDSIPLLHDFRQWLEAQQRDVLPKSPMGMAIQYALSNWNALERYCEDGDLDIDNNAAERDFRVIAVGRKNWLFVGSERGGDTAAVLFSFTVTCRNLRIDPYAYLRDVLERISAHPSTQLADLLPDRWAARNDDK